MENYGHVSGLAYQSSSKCNVNNFSLFNIISVITHICLYILAMIPHMKESNLPNFSHNPLKDKLHYEQRCIN